MIRRSALVAAGGLLATGAILAAIGCGSGGGDEGGGDSWQLVHDGLPGGLLSVWGTSSRDVWAVGAAPLDGAAPTVLHFDGTSWSSEDTGSTGDLWWVFGFAAGPVYAGGTGGQILRYANGSFERMQTPGTGNVFGIWGSSANDVWAVGGQPGGANGAFAWRLSGDSWTEVPDFPSGLASTDALWKVFGRGSDDVWMVGTGGKTLHWDGSTLTQAFTGLAESLFTVHGNSQRFVAVGGYGTGLILERAVPDADSTWVNVSPPSAPSIVGVCLTEKAGYAVGEFGYVATRGRGGWQDEKTSFDVTLGVRSLHSVWLDPDGGVWTVGGEIRELPLTDGVMLHKGKPVPTGTVQ
jgi:hypothetical protein